MQLNCAESETDLRAVLTVPDVPEIRRTLTQIRPDLAEDSLSFRAALLLLTGPTVSFNIDRLACRTQIPRSVVAACTRRLFDNGVWQHDGPAYAWRSADDAQFWSDVGVAEGQLCRRTDPLGRIEWANAGAWRKAYEFSVTETEPTPFSIAYSTEPERPAAAPAAGADTAGEPAVSLPVAETRLVRNRARPRRKPEVAIVAGVAADTARATWLGAPETGKGDLFPGANWLV